MEAKMKMEVEFVTRGFKPSELSPRRMWSVLKDEFMELHNDYCARTNKVLDALNKEFEEKYPEEPADDKAEQEEILNLKDEIRQWQYNAYIHDCLEQCVYDLNQSHIGYLSAVLKMEEGMPVLWARIRQHPDCTMTFVVKSK